MVLRPAAIAVQMGVWLEAGLLVVASAWMTARLAAGGDGSPLPGLALVVFSLLLAGLLFAAVRSLVRDGSGPARALVVTWQIVQAGTAGSIIGAADVPAQAVLGAWAAVVVAVVVVVAALLDARGPEREAARERQAR